MPRSLVRKKLFLSPFFPNRWSPRPSPLYLFKFAPYLVNPSALDLSSCASWLAFNPLGEVLLQRWIETQTFREVLLSCGFAAQAEKSQSTVAVSASKMRIESYRLRKVGDGACRVVLSTQDEGPMVVGPSQFGV